MNRIERYLGSVVVVHTLLVMFVLLVLIGFTAFMNEVTRTNDNYTLWMAALFVVLEIPSNAYQLFPVALLIGTLMGLGSLANHSELTVLRVTGWSIQRLFFSIAKVALIFWALMALMGENLGSSAQIYADKFRGEALNKGFSIGSQNGFWINNNERYIQIGRALSDKDLRNVAIYQVAQVANEFKVTQAVNGQQETERQKELKLVEHYPKVVFQEGAWWVENGQKTELSWQHWHSPQPSQSDETKRLIPRDVTWIELQNHAVNRSVLNLPFAPEDLEKLTTDVKSLNLWQLQEQIRFLSDNGGETRQLELALWNKLASPVVVLAMIAIVFPLIFGSQRQVSMGQRIFVGVLIGLLFHLGNQLVGNLSMVYQFPAAISAFLPAGMLLMIALAWLRWQK